MEAIQTTPCDILTQTITITVPLSAVSAVNNFVSKCWNKIQKEKCKKVVEAPIKNLGKRIQDAKALHQGALLTTNERTRRKLCKQVEEILSSVSEESSDTDEETHLAREAREERRAAKIRQKANTEIACQKVVQLANANATTGTTKTSITGKTKKNETYVTETKQPIREKPVMYSNYTPDDKPAAIQCVSYKDTAACTPQPVAKRIAPRPGPRVVAPQAQQPSTIVQVLPSYTDPRIGKITPIALPHEQKYAPLNTSYKWNLKTPLEKLKEKRKEWSEGLNKDC